MILRLALGWIWLCWCFSNAAIAEQKNRSMIAILFLSLICSPLVIWAYIMAVPPKPFAEEKTATKS